MISTSGALQHPLSAVPERGINAAFCRCGALRLIVDMGTRHVGEYDSVRVHPFLHKYLIRKIFRMVGLLEGGEMIGHVCEWDFGGEAGDGEDASLALHEAALSVLLYLSHSRFGRAQYSNCSLHVSGKHDRRQIVRTIWKGGRG